MSCDLAEQFTLNYMNVWYFLTLSPLFRYQWKNYQYVLAFLFAIEEISKSPHLLPNLSLGYDLYNAFTSDKRTLENAVFLLSGGNQTLPNYNCQTQKQSVAIIAGNEPIFSVQVGALLELYKSAQVISLQVGN